MREDLEQFREIFRGLFVNERLSYIPILGGDMLFNLGNLRFTKGKRACTPCRAFGPYLVLKIIDEILDE